MPRYSKEQRKAIKDAGRAIQGLIRRRIVDMQSIEVNGQKTSWELVFDDGSKLDGVIGGGLWVHEDRTVTLTIEVRGHITVDGKPPPSPKPKMIETGPKLVALDGRVLVR